MKSYIREACDCGKIHRAALRELIIENGAIRHLPSLIRRFGGSRIFLLADKNTYAAAGEAISHLLDEAGIPYTSFVFPDNHLIPDEKAVGAAIMHYDPACDLILAVGSGVINDIGKIVSHTASKPYIIAATAPSMDGYASDTSAMERGGLKISMPTKSPDAIVGDIDILKKAPLPLLHAGLGDMLAKYVSICEWQMDHLICGEFYCDKIAALVRDSLKKCTDNAEGLLQREDTAVAAVFEGLVVTGLAMAYAGKSRPASGIEHYFSHVWDMRGLAFGTKTDLHGRQCAIGTLMTIQLYEKLRQITPNREKALAYVRSFDYSEWSNHLRALCGNGAAEEMIVLEAKEGKYDIAKHGERLKKVLASWDNILQIAEAELPDSESIRAMLKRIGAPVSPAELGIDEEFLPDTFRATKDIRDKYGLSRLAWDLGILDELAETLRPVSKN